MDSPIPVIGAWYRRPDGATFEVVAVDHDDGTIEIQHFDGTLEELDFETWDEQAMQEAQAPEDWSGSIDIEPDDFESDRDMHFQAPDPLGYLDRNEAIGFSEWPTPSDERF